MDRERLIRHYETMCFSYQSTHLDEFRGHSIKPQGKTVYQEKPQRQVPRPPPNLKCIESLREWGGKKELPFDLFVKPKEIIWTNSFTYKQEKFTKPVDPDRLRAQETRPRMAMTPAVNLDDIDPSVRDVIVEDMYTSEMTRGNREAIQPYFSVAAPLPERPTNADPLKLPQSLPAMVPMEWRKESCSWDRQQQRMYWDLDKEFWLSRPPIQCMKCDESAAVTKHKKLLRQMKGKMNYNVFNVYV